MRLPDAVVGHGRLRSRQQRAVPALLRGRPHRGVRRAAQRRRQQPARHRHPRRGPPHRVPQAADLAARAGAHRPVDHPPGRGADRRRLRGLRRARRRAQGGVRGGRVDPRRLRPDQRAAAPAGPEDVERLDALRGEPVRFRQRSRATA
nr:hypothetical protein [Angustibacter aerolatus]